MALQRPRGNVRGRAQEPDWPKTTQELIQYLQTIGQDYRKFTNEELTAILNGGPDVLMAAISAAGEAGDTSIVQPTSATTVPGLTPAASDLPEGNIKRRAVDLYKDVELSDAIRILINNGVSFSNIKKVVDQWKKDELYREAAKSAQPEDEPPVFTQEDLDAHGDPNGGQLLVAIANGLSGADPASPNRKVTPVITSDRFDKVLREVNKTRPLEKGEDIRPREDIVRSRDEGFLGVFGALEKATAQAFYGVTGAAGSRGKARVNLPTPGWDRTQETISPELIAGNTKEYLGSFVLDVFREDDDVREGLVEVLMSSGNEALVWELGLEDYLPNDPRRPKYGPTGEPMPYKRETGESLTVEEITRRLVAAGVLPESLSRELVDMYRTGRFELAFNDPRRDPTNSVSKLETENHSESLDRKIENRPFDRVNVAEPWTLYLADDLAQSLKDNPMALLRDFNPSSPLLNRAGSDIEKALTARYAEFISAGASDPQGQILPTDLVAPDIRYGIPPSEVEPEREFLAQMPERAPSTLDTLHPSERQLAEEASLDAYHKNAQDLLKKADPTYTQTVQDAIMGWKELSDADRKQIQFAAYLSGKYGDTNAIDPTSGEGVAVDPEQVLNGDVNDVVAFNFWAEAVRTSAFTTMQGSKPLTPMKVIRRIVDTQKSTYRNVIKKDRDQRRNEINKTPVAVELTASTAIAEMARDVGQSLMGRNPSNEDYKNIIAMVHDRERQDQLARAKATADTELSQLEEEATYNFGTLDQLEGDIMGSNVFEDPSGGLNFTDPLALADYGSMLASTEDRIARMKQREIKAPAEAEIPYNPEVTETEGFDLLSALKNYYRENYQADIDASKINEILGQLNYLLASPVSA